jgi:nitrite reductase/ring-hydroxylating ferredoxin subunit
MPDTNEDSDKSRRRFCNQLLLTSAGLVLVVSDTNVLAKTVVDNPLVYPPVRIAGAERLQPGSFLYFDYPRSNDPAVLLRTQFGEYQAFSRKCAHRGCSVEVDSARGCLECPCHRGAYDTKTGYVVYGPPRRALDQIVLQVRAGGELWAVGKRMGGNPNGDEMVRN